MKHLYLLAQREGTSFSLNTITQQNEISDWQQKAAMILSAASPNEEWGVSVFFSQLWNDTGPMYEALREAVHLAPRNLQGEAVPEQVDTWLRENWTELAFGAYENYLDVGKGCNVLIQGLINSDSFRQIRVDYKPLKDFLEFFGDEQQLLSPEMLTAAKSYNPETDLAVFVVQPNQPLLCIAGSTIQGLPSPRSIWEQHKDEPQFHE